MFNVYEYARASQARNITVLLFVGVFLMSWHKWHNLCQSMVCGKNAYVATT